MKRTFWLLKIVLVYRGCWIIKCRIREGRLYYLLRGLACTEDNCISGIKRFGITASLLMRLVQGVINLRLPGLVLQPCHTNQGRQAVVQDWAMTRARAKLHLPMPFLFKVKENPNSHSQIRAKLTSILRMAFIKKFLNS